MPQRIQRKRTKGWKMPPNTVSVTRPGRWGNPYTIRHNSGWWFVDGPHTPLGGIRCGNKEGATLVAVAKFRETADGAATAELRGKDLACFCQLDQPCHADVLLELANRADITQTQEK